MNLPVAETKSLLDGLTTDLCSSMESGDRENVLAAQKIFTKTIATLWKALEHGEVDRKIKSVLRLIAGWAIYELPEQILDPVNDEKIRRELKLFQRSLIMIDP
jgi:hypothetical protein